MRQQDIPSIRIDIPPARTLAPDEKINLLQCALAARPEAAHLRVELADLLVQRDRFGDALALLENIESFPETLRFRAYMTVGNAALGKESPEWNASARSAFARAVACAPGSRAQAGALAQHGKAQSRLGNHEGARRSLLAALAANPRNPDAQKRLTALDLAQGREAEALARCEALLAGGVFNSRLLSDRYLALALLGRASDAQAAEALDVFFPALEPGPPTGWDTVDAFNRALYAEMESHPALRYERYGTASTSSWRIDNPQLQRTPAFSALLAVLQQEIQQQLAAIPEAHLLGRARPERAMLHTWCVLTQASGHEEWHMHQSGWISGVYYITVPDEVTRASDHRGCIEFGNPVLAHIPRDIPGERRTLRPRPGRLLMFASQAYHRTYPSTSPAWRMAVAFDLVPLYH